MTIDQKICGFEIPMHYVGGVDEIDGAQLVVEYDDDVVLGQLSLRYGVHKFLKVGLHDFHDYK